jgi:hypothetical protein
VQWQYCYLDFADMENLVWESREPIAQVEQQSSSSVRRVDNRYWSKKVSKDNCNTVFSFLSPTCWSLQSERP